MASFGEHCRATALIFSPKRCFWSMFKRNDTRQQYSGYEILDFLRSVSVLWLICLHQQNQWVLQEWFDLPRFSEEEILWWNGFLWAGHFSVDLFLLISGFLIGMIIIREQKKYNRRVNLRRFYFRRLLRIYPLLLVNFAAYYAVEVFMLSDTRCQENWWATLFFVNNLPQAIDYNDSCMLWTWSLALEMQFYLIISLILAATPNRLDIHKGICWFVVVGVVVIRLVITIDINASFPPVIPEFSGTRLWSTQLYLPGYTRIGNLFIGVLTAIYEMEAKARGSKKPPEMAPQDSLDKIKLEKAGKCCWPFLLALCVVVVVTFSLLNWSLLLDSQCTFSLNCGCPDKPLASLTKADCTQNPFNAKHFREVDDYSPFNKSACVVFDRLSEQCNNGWLPHWLQALLFASYRTIFCGAYGILVYYCLIESKRRKEAGENPSWYLRFFSWSIWFFIAQISYGIYLWNQMLIYVVQGYMFQHTFEDELHLNFGWKLLLLLACIVVTTIFAIVTYIFVEKPFMDIRDYSKFLKKVQQGARSRRVKSVIDADLNQEANENENQRSENLEANNTQQTQNSVALS